jgi:hypothetical protein
VAHVAVLDLLAGARAGPAVVSHVLRQGHRAPRAAPRGRHPAPHKPTSALGLGGEAAGVRVGDDRSCQGAVARGAVAAATEMG